MISQKLKFREKVGYGFGDAATSIFMKLFSMYLMFFYTDVYGISAGLAGTMILITRITDSVFDPFVGILSDRTETAWGKFRPYLLWMAFPFAILGILVFSVPDTSANGKVIYAFVTYSLMMMFYSLINIPYSSLIGVMTADGKERTSMATYRFIFAFGGSLLVMALAEPLIDIFSRMNIGAVNIRQGWQLTAIIFAIVVFFLLILSFSLTRERIKPSSLRNPVRKDLADLLTNRPLFILVAAFISAIFFNSIRDGAAIYFFRYYIQDQGAFSFNTLKLTITYSSLYLMLGQAANILGVIMARPVSDRFGKKNTFMYAMMLATILSIAFYWLHRDNLIMIFVIQFLICINTGIIIPLIWSMFADASDYSEWKTGRRATGLVFSSSSLSQKLGLTLGSATAGWLLGYYGFEANVIQNASVLQGLKLMLSFLPAIGSIAASIFIFMYPLNEKKMMTVSAELAVRRDAVRKK
jgi:glycoside/pentoside/hexuronide:cation symporter, GPH family